VRTSASWDVIVAGAGHNALVCAAYLSRAGLRVLVLERSAEIGGDTSTEELTLPGFLHDACASAHVLIQSSPILRRDELGLARYGLRYIQPDPVVVMPFRDGRSVTMFRDRAATRAELGRFGDCDARAYDRLLDDWDAIKDAVGEARYRPPESPATFLAELERTPPGLQAVRWRLASAEQVVRERFADEHVRTFFLWLSLMTMAWVDQPGTGLLPMSISAGRQAFSWTTPVGGSIALPRALAAIVEECGGEVRTGCEVTRVLIEDGRAIGVGTADGRSYLAERAVVSSVHLKHLPGLIGKERLGAEFLAAAARWRTGITMFVAHHALDAPPRYRLEQGATASVAAGIVESTRELLEALAVFRAGELQLERPPMLAVCSSVVDERRAPPGQHTLKLVGFMPYDLRDGGPERWDAIKNRTADALLDQYLGYTTNLSRGNVLARHVESPLDLERRNPHNYRGSCHGGDQDLAQEGALRFPGGGYRLPVDGLYQTGSTTHPGASVTGAPGRNCAQVVLGDLDLAWPASVVSP
jgi:phytoene dehydrogenase-like protein